MPTIISLDTVCAITEISKSTWRRRIAKGDFTRLEDDARGRAMLLWSEVEPHICVPLEPEDKQFILLADAGDAEAQDDIGQLFLMSKRGFGFGVLVLLTARKLRDRAFVRD